MQYYILNYLLFINYYSVYTQNEIKDLISFSHLTTSSAKLQVEALVETFKIYNNTFLASFSHPF